MKKKQTKCDSKSQAVPQTWDIKFAEFTLNLYSPQTRLLPHLQDGIENSERCMFNILRRIWSMAEISFHEWSIFKFFAKTYFWEFKILTSRIIAFDKFYVLFYFLLSFKSINLNYLVNLVFFNNLGWEKANSKRTISLQKLIDLIS